MLKILFFSEELRIQHILYLYIGKANRQEITFKRSNKFESWVAEKTSIFPVIEAPNQIQRLDVAEPAVGNLEAGVEKRFIGGEFKRTEHSDRVWVSLLLEDQDPSVRVIDIDTRSSELGDILHDKRPVAVSRTAIVLASRDVELEFLVQRLNVERHQIRVADGISDGSDLGDYETCPFPANYLLPRSLTPGTVRNRRNEFGVRLLGGKAVSFSPNADDEDLLPLDIVGVKALFGPKLVLHVFVGFQVRYRVIEEKSSGISSDWNTIRKFQHKVWCFESNSILTVVSVDVGEARSNTSIILCCGGLETFEKLILGHD